MRETFHGYYAGHILIVTVAYIGYTSASQQEARTKCIHTINNICNHAELV